MSETPAPSDPGVDFVEAHRAETAARVLRLYYAIIVLMIAGIVGLFVYVVRLGALVGTGVETSFGLAVAAMFTMGAMLVHLVDRTYRSWPLGRRFRPATPGPVTPSGTATLLSWLVVAAALGGAAYVVAQLLM
ncbi:MAG: hypothetical protein L3K00_06350 [Thermoplasmata archaeon]|nr:hypothetical protein [Thermoplasmata archaeon]